MADRERTKLRSPGLRAQLAQLLGGEPRLLGFVIALACTYGFFVDAPSWNQNSRYALTRAVVEHGQLTIDEYHATTGDKSYREGHFYCDKAPGTSLLAVPAYGVFHGLRRLGGLEPPRVEVEPLDPLDAAADRRPDPEDRLPGDRLRYDAAYRAGLWLCRMSTVSLATLAAVIALWLLALGQQGERSAERAGPRRRNLALGIAAIYALATPALPYGAAFYGHQLCAALLFLGFAGVLLGDQARRPLLVAVLVGTAFGLAVCCEYPAAAPVILLSAHAAWRRGLRFTAGVIAGGLPWAVLLAAYHHAAFGSALATGYDFVYLPEFAEGMAINYGIGAPDPRVAWSVLFGSYRGLFYLAPVLLVATWGLALPWPDADRSLLGTPERVVAILLCVFYVLLTSGYYMWDGGAAFGPRHAIPMLPFLALGLLPALERIPRATIGLAAWSAIVMLLGATFGPEVPPHGDPVWSFAVPELLWGEGVGGARAQTLGSVLGLPGLLAFVPLVLVWVGLVPWRNTADSEGSSGSRPSR